jgi:predicted nucleic acid-binding protein
MKIVLDASITLARVYADEVTPSVIQVFLQVQQEGAVTPALWQWEVANILEMNARKGRYTISERDRMLQEVRDLPVAIDKEGDFYLWSNVIQLAHRHRLTIYDATYLELAMRLGLPLATLDLQLRSAAAAEGVPLLGL